MNEYDLEALITAGKLRTHCTKLSAGELLDKVIAIYNKYLLPEIVNNTRPSNWISVDALIPKLHEMLKDEVVVAGCVSFDTIREAIKQLKASPPGDE